MNIALTGHKGLIGTFLKERLEMEGHNIVFEIDTREGKDIRDLKDLKINFKADIMIHMAAHCKINESISNPQRTFDNNVEGTFAVFEFCRKNNIPKIIDCMSVTKKGWQIPMEVDFEIGFSWGESWPFHFNPEGQLVPTGTWVRK